MVQSTEVGKQRAKQNLSQKTFCLVFELSKTKASGSECPVRRASSSQPPW